MLEQTKDLPLRDILGLDAKHFKRVATILFQYLFGGIGKYEYRDEVGDKHLQRDVWARAEKSGYVLRNCKLFAYAVAYNRDLGISTSPASYEILGEDVGFLRGLDLSFIDPHAACRPYRLFDYRNLEATLLTSDALRVLTGKFISRKLIFLDKHFGVKRADIEQTLNDAALYGLRKQYPYYDSDLHALNICKTSVRNRGHGLIEYYTREKRSKLLKENGSFQAVDVPLDSVVGLSVQPEHENETAMNMQSLWSLESRMTPKLRDFLRAAAGQYDAGFTMFIGVNNEDAAAEWDSKKYMAQLRTYHKVSEERAASMLLKLRNAIS
jgi:hypothetical protein